MVKVSYRGPTYKINLFGRSSPSSEFAGFVKDIACYNQGEFIQYSYLAAEFHKCMKTAFAEGDEKNARECKSVLINYLNRNLERITKKNFEFLHSHFRRRESKPPRICVKGGYDIENKDSVISLFRDNRVNYDSNCLIEQNSGFKYIYDTGRPYVCNDIPKKAKVGEYANPRLNLASAKNYPEPNWIKKKLRWTEREDEAWQRCWDNSNGPSLTEDSCYKATMIIPMTLWNNSLDNSFKELIRLEEVDRTIFGFLCVDHVNTDYFIEDIDIPIGYVFSDLLSLYLISRMVYTEISDTFRAIDEVEAA